MSDEVGQTAEKKKDQEEKKEAAALDKLTDKVEEKELDASKVQQAIHNIASTQESDAKKQREKDLASVKVKASDINIVVEQFEVNKKVAERRLRENKGDLRQTLESFLGFPSFTS